VNDWSGERQAGSPKEKVMSKLKDKLEKARKAVKEEALRLLAEGEKSYSEIAAAVGTTESSVYKWAKAHGLTRTDRKAKRAEETR